MLTVPIENQMLKERCKHHGDNPWTLWIMLYRFCLLPTVRPRECSVQISPRES